VSPTGGYAGSSHASDVNTGDEQERSSMGGSSVQGGERKKPGTLKGMFKKLKA
jgi:hypothetical protein